MALQTLAVQRNIYATATHESESFKVDRFRVCVIKQGKVRFASNILQVHEYGSVFFILKLGAMCVWRTCCVVAMILFMQGLSFDSDIVSRFKKASAWVLSVQVRRTQWQMILCDCKMISVVSF